MKPLQKMSDEEMRDLGLTGDWWKNDLYRVRVVKSEPWNGRSMIRLSIKRHDGKPIDPAWRDKQAIKNQLIGKEREGIELYPAESREQNQSHQYHLWVVDDTKFLGSPTGLVGMRSESRQALTLRSRRVSLLMRKSNVGYRY